METTRASTEAEGGGAKRTDVDSGTAVHDVAHGRASLGVIRLHGCIPEISVGVVGRLQVRVRLHVARRDRGRRRARRHARVRLERRRRVRHHRGAVAGRQRRARLLPLAEQHVKGERGGAFGVAAVAAALVARLDRVSRHLGGDDRCGGGRVEAEDDRFEPDGNGRLWRRAQGGDAGEVDQLRHGVGEGERG